MTNYNFSTEDQPQTERVPNYGAFKANISECIVKPNADGEMERVSANGVNYIVLELTIDYFLGDKQKTKKVWLTPGFWFSDQIKTILTALSLNKEDMGDVSKLKGKDVGILIAPKPYDERSKDKDGNPRHVRSFKGLGVINFVTEEGELIESLDMDIVKFIPYTSVNNSEMKDEFARIEGIKKEFADSLKEKDDELLTSQPGFENPDVPF